MKLVGTIHKIYDTQEITPTFKKRDFVLKTQEQYPQDISIQVTQDKVNILNEYSVGDVIEVDINIKGREWINPEGVAKYFNTIEGWRISRSDSSNGSIDGVQNKQDAANKINNLMAEGNFDYSDDGDDDLPF